MIVNLATLSIRIFIQRLTQKVIYHVFIYLKRSKEEQEMKERKKSKSMIRNK